MHKNNHDNRAWRQAVIVRDRPLARGYSFNKCQPSDGAKVQCAYKYDSGRRPVYYYELLKQTPPDERDDDKVSCGDAARINTELHGGLGYLVPHGRITKSILFINNAITREDTLLRKKSKR